MTREFPKICHTASGGAIPPRPPLLMGETVPPPRAVPPVTPPSMGESLPHCPLAGGQPPGRRLRRRVRRRWVGMLDRFFGGLVFEVSGVGSPFPVALSRGGASPSRGSGGAGGVAPRRWPRPV